MNIFSNYKYTDERNAEVRFGSEGEGEEREGEGEGSSPRDTRVPTHIPQAAVLSSAIKSTRAIPIWRISRPARGKLSHAKRLQQ